MAENRFRKSAGRNSPTGPTRVTPPTDRPVNLRFKYSDQEARYNLICDKRIHDVRPMDWVAIKTIGLGRYVKNYVPTASRNLLKLRDLQYRELILEFYSTYSYTFVEDPAEDCMRFRLAGIWFHLSLYDFAMALDIYTNKEEIEQLLGNALKFRKSSDRGSEGRSPDNRCTPLTPARHPGSQTHAYAYYTASSLSYSLDVWSLQGMLRSQTSTSCTAGRSRTLTFA